MGKELFSTNYCGTTGCLHARQASKQTNNLDIFFHEKMKLKWIINLKHKSKPIKFLEDKADKGEEGSSDVAGPGASFQMEYQGHHP